MNLNNNLNNYLMMRVLHFVSVFFLYENQRVLLQADNEDFLIRDVILTLLYRGVHDNGVLVSIFYLRAYNDKNPIKSH